MTQSSDPSPIAHFAQADERKAAMVFDRRRELKIKIKSLAEEARIIRKEEQRCLKSARKTPAEKYPEQKASLYGSYFSLYRHRTEDVRQEARYSLLAYQLIRGKTLASAEPKCKVDKIKREKLFGLVQRFTYNPTHFPGARVWHMKEVEDWLEVKEQSN